VNFTLFRTNETIVLGTIFRGRIEFPITVSGSTHAPEKRLAIETILKFKSAITTSSFDVFQLFLTLHTSLARNPQICISLFISKSLLFRLYRCAILLDWYPIAYLR